MIQLQEVGWHVTIPLPKRKQANAKARELKQEYREVEVKKVNSGWVVRYRSPFEILL